MQGRLVPHQHARTPSCAGRGAPASPAEPGSPAAASRGCYSRRVCLSPAVVCAGVTLVKIKTGFISSASPKHSLSLPILFCPERDYPPSLGLGS